MSFGENKGLPLSCGGPPLLRTLTRGSTKMPRTELTPGSIREKAMAAMEAAQEIIQEDGQIVSVGFVINTKTGVQLSNELAEGQDPWAFYGSMLLMAKATDADLVLSVGMRDWKVLVHAQTPIYAVLLAQAVRPRKSVSDLFELDGEVMELNPMEREGAFGKIVTTLNAKDETGSVN